MNLYLARKLKKGKQLNVQLSAQKAVNGPDLCVDNLFIYSKKYNNIIIIYTICYYLLLVNNRNRSRPDF